MVAPQSDHEDAGLGPLHRLPPRPPEELDRVLDAVERCLTRYGLRRTSMSDVARELGVARTTLYRQVSSIDEATGLVSSRRLHRFLDKLLTLGGAGLSADTFVEAIARSVRLTLADPVITRLRSDEPEILGGLLSQGVVAEYVTQIGGLLTPVVAAAMEAGAIRSADPARTADWLVRATLVLTAVPVPDDDLDDAVRALLLPLLAPDRP